VKRGREKRKAKSRKKKGKKNKGKTGEHAHVNKNRMKNEAGKLTQYTATGSSKIELSKNITRYFSK
jgi:hypothetical protein